MVCDFAIANSLSIVTEHAQDALPSGHESSTEHRYLPMRFCRRISAQIYAVISEHSNGHRHVEFILANYDYIVDYKASSRHNSYLVHISPNVNLNPAMSFFTNKAACVAVAAEYYDNISAIYERSASE